VGVDSVLESLHHVAVGSFADVSEVYTASIFRASYNFFVSTDPIGHNLIGTVNQKPTCVQMLTNRNEFGPEDGGRMRLRNVGNSGHIHMVQIPKSGAEYVSCNCRLTSLDICLSFIQKAGARSSVVG
jgi:hypothetical protein